MYTFLLRDQSKKKQLKVIGAVNLKVLKYNVWKSLY